MYAIPTILLNIDYACLTPICWLHQQGENGTPEVTDQLYHTILYTEYTSQWMGTQFTNSFLSHCIVDRDSIIRGGLGYH